MPKIYVEPENNTTEKGINSVGVSKNKKQVEFNQDVNMKYIPKITGVQTKIIKLARHANNPNYLSYLCRSVLAKLRSEKVKHKCNGGH